MVWRNSALQLSSVCTSSGMMARCRRHSSFGAISILVKCALSGLLLLQVSIALGSTHGHPLGRLPSHVGRQDRDMTPNDAAFTAFKQAVLLPRTDVGALISLEKSEPIIVSHLDHSADASDSTLGDACHTSRLSQSRLEPHDPEAGDVEVDEAALGCSVGNQRVSSCLRPTAETSGKQEGQGVVAEESKRIACSTEPFATRDPPGRLPSHVGRQDRDTTPNDAAFPAFKQAVLLPRTDVGALISLEKSEPIIVSRLDHSAGASESALGDACHTSRLSPSRLEPHDADGGDVEGDACHTSRLSPSRLEPHDAEGGDVEVDEAARGCSAGNQQVSSCPRSTAEMPGEQKGQGAVAEESKRIARSTEPFATRDVLGEIACKGQVQVLGSCAEGEQTTMNGDGKRPSQESHGKQEVLPGAVDAVEATALDIPEAPAWRDLDVCVAPWIWDSHAGKDVGGGSNAGGPNAAPGPPNEGSGAVIEMDSERKSLKKGAHYCTDSLSCPEYASDLFNVPAAVPEQEAPERRGPRVKGVGTNIAAIETDRIDGGDAAVNLAGKLVVTENVSVGAGRLPWALWVCAMLLCVVLVSYEYIQGNLARWVPFVRGGPREGWAVDFDDVIAAARSRAGSLGSGKQNSTAEVNGDLGIPDLMSEDNPLPLSDARRESVAQGRPAAQAYGSEDLMWDTRPKPFDHLVFDPVLGVVPWGVLDAWARARREGAGPIGEGDAFTNRCSSVSSSVTEDDVDDGSASPRGACCGKPPSWGRRGHQKRALPPVRYTPEWHAWKAARASSKRTESADRVGSGGKMGPEGSRSRSVNGGEAGAAVAAGAVAFGKNVSPVGAKIRMPKAVDSELEDVVAGAKGGIEYGDVSADACGGNPLEIASKVCDGTTSSEFYLARLSSASREVSPIRPSVQPCV